MPVVTLITDYGQSDHYVGALKGVILSIAPSVRIVDITHEIPPHGIQQGAFVLRQIHSLYPPDTVHLVVVDPGVGSSRRILLARYDGRYVVAPDNGLLTFVHRDLPTEAMYVVEDRRYFRLTVSSTFHGRDIMAPVAAHLAQGETPRLFGRLTDRIELLAIPHEAEFDGHVLRGRVLYVDRFGTLVTNIGRDQLVAVQGTGVVPEVRVGDVWVGPIRSTFSDVPPGEPVALIGGCGLVEVAVNRGRAIDRFGPAEAAQVEVFPPVDA